MQVDPRQMSLIGGVFPVWHVFRALSGYGAVSATTVSEPLRVAALAVSDQPGRKRIVLANRTASPVTVIIAPTNGTVRLLEESKVADATREPEAWWKRPPPSLTGAMALPAYAVAFVNVA